MCLDVVYSIIDKGIVSLEDLEILRSCKNVKKVSLAMISKEFDIFNVVVINSSGYEYSYLVYLLT